MADQLTGQLPLQVVLDCVQVRLSSPDPRRAHAAGLLPSRRPGPFGDGDTSVATWRYWWRWRTSCPQPPPPCW